MSYAERVRAGVTLLDEKLPGWHQRVDLDDLDLSDYRRCVLGQLYGGFSRGLRDLDLLIRWDVEVEYGFDLHLHGDELSLASSYDLLTRLWSFVIRQRQAVAA